MNYINLIDSCQAHLPVQYASNIKFIRQMWYWCCDWQQAAPESQVQNKLLHWLSVFTLAVSLFRFTLQQNREYDYISNAKMLCFLNCE